MAWGYWPGCYRPNAGLGLLARQLQPTGGTGLAATSPMLAWGYWLLQAAGLPWGTGLAAAAHMGVLAVLRAAGWPKLLVRLLQTPGWPEGYWPGCYMPQVCLGLLIWLLQPTSGTGLAATGRKLAWGYWPVCC